MRQAVAALFGGAVTVQERALPAGTHGPRAALPASEGKAQARFDARVAAWAPLADDSAERFGGCHALIQAPLWFEGGGADDTVNKAAGRYAIDEGDGLVLDAFRRGDALVTVFLAGENRIFSQYERVRDGAGPLLRFEVTGAPAAPITRSELPNGAPLLVYDVGVRQQALLRRASTR